MGMGKERPNNALKTSHWLLISYYNDKAPQYLKTSPIGLFHPLPFFLFFFFILIENAHKWIIRMNNKSGGINSITHRRDKIN